MSNESSKPGVTEMFSKAADAEKAKIEAALAKQVPVSEMFRRAIAYQERTQPDPAPQLPASVLFAEAEAQAALNKANQRLDEKGVPRT